MHNDESNKSSEIANAERALLEQQLLEKFLTQQKQQLIVQQQLIEQVQLAFKFTQLSLKQPPDRDTLSTTTMNIWERGDRAIALASGGGILGGAIAQIPGAIIGATFGAALGFFGKSRRSVSENQ